MTPPPPPNHSSHNSPDAMTSASGPRRTFFCTPQEDATVCSGQCDFHKRTSDAAIGQSPCVTSIPSDTPQPFISRNFFSSATITGDTFHCAKRFTVIREEGPSEGLFDKDPAPPTPDIHNLTAPPSPPGDPIEAGVFNASNKSEKIALFRNQELEVGDDTEPSPNNVPLADTPDSDTLFEGQTWGCNDIDLWAVAAHNQN